MAEVLITLTIIGVIAALTIPNLMQKWSDHADVAKVKEAYSILNNALKMAIAENGPIESWGMSNNYTKAENVDIFGANFSKYLKIQKNCGRNNGCFNYGWQTNGSHSTETAGSYKTLNGSNGRPLEQYGSYSADKIILTNGMRIQIDGHSLYNEDSSGNILVDINGKNKPNRLGYDIFYFGIYRDKLIPTPNPYWGSYSYCNPNGTTAGDGDRDGVACFKWILRKGNMDYKYRDVSAEW